MRRSKLIKNTCRICGNSFYSKKPATLCIEKSTCRVKARREREHSEAIAKQFTMDLESYATYIRLTDIAPNLKPLIDDAILRHDLAASKQWLVIIQKMIDVAAN